MVSKYKAQVGMVLAILATFSDNIAKVNAPTASDYVAAVIAAVATYAGVYAAPRYKRGTEFTKQARTSSVAAPAASGETPG